jgi:hypothetical protein
MKKSLSLAVALVALAVSPARAAGDLWKESSQACVFGAAVLGGTSVIVLYPAMVVGAADLPIGSLIIGNTLFGCGISALGAMAAQGYGHVYDRWFGPSAARGDQAPIPCPATPEKAQAAPQG